MTKIPRCMSTQHPDNVNSPFFVHNSEIGGEDEVQEAYYALSHLGCDEQMWDCEGKEVDSFVVKKLLSRYGHFFKERPLGKDLFITLRVPNPTVEKAEAKVLLETLESIPRSFDAARSFSPNGTAPIFEVIMPMTTSSQCLNRIYTYYRDFVVGKQTRPFGEGDITIAEWIGEFRPETINVIPLFEDMESMLKAHETVQQYLADKDLEYQRVFLARSDPAMNYGLVTAVLLNKIVLRRLHQLSHQSGVAIYPIVGVGSAPFRGNLRPDTVERVAREYPSACTFTIQSAFKYDNPAEVVAGATAKLRERAIGTPGYVDEKTSLEIIDKYCRAYQIQIATLSEAINAMAQYIPSRRKRKLHIGLFGYSRNVGGITLPRAITFTAALYSLGLPPEILGLNALDRDDLRFLRETYLNFDDDIRDAVKYLDPDTPFLPPEIKKWLTDYFGDFETDKPHQEITRHIVAGLKENRNADAAESVLRAACRRKFLG